MGAGNRRLSLGVSLIFGSTSRSASPRAAVPRQHHTLERNRSLQKKKRQVALPAALVPRLPPSRKLINRLLLLSCSGGSKNQLHG